MNLHLKSIIPQSRLLLTLLILILLTSNGFSQDAGTLLGTASLSTQNKGMYVLGGWAIANMAFGAHGWSQYGNERMYFHQMNLFWNAVNLSIAGIALYNNAQVDLLGLSAHEVLANHIKTERILLINSALDIGYIGTGFLLRHLSNSSLKYESILCGYGNSLILQGGFLLVFDLLLYQILRLQRLEFIDSLNLIAGADHFGLSVLINI